MAGTRSTMDESQSLSIDARALWWLDDVHGKTIFFLENRDRGLRTQAVCGVGWGMGLGDRRVVCAHTGLVCTLVCVCAQQHATS